MSERDREPVIWHVRYHPGTSPGVYRHVLGLTAEFIPVVQPLPPTAPVARLRSASAVFSQDPRRLAQRFLPQAVAPYGAPVHVGVAGAWSTAVTASAHAGRTGVLHLPDHRAVEAFLHPLPVDALHGIGPARADSLRRFGLHTVGALAAMPRTSSASSSAEGRAAFCAAGPRNRPAHDHRAPDARVEQRPHLLARWGHPVVRPAAA